MSAGFDVSGEVCWGSNGSIEVYLEVLGELAAARLGADHPMTAFFHDELETFFIGKVVRLDEILVDSASCERFLDLLDAATKLLLEREVFTDHGRTWADWMVGQLRARIEEV